MTGHQVIIVGGGPTGMMLAAELAIAGIDVAIVERRADQALPGSRAKGLHARTIEVMEQRGVAERFVSAGQPVQAVGFSFIPLDISDFPSRHAYTLALGQDRFEQIMAEWLAELPVTILRGRAVMGIAQTDEGVSVALSDGAVMDAQYLVGCDGGRSFVRRAAGIDFPGWDATTSYLIAEAKMTEAPPWGMRRGEKGVNAIGKLDDGSRVGLVLVEPQVGTGDEPTMDDLRAALIAVYGTDFGVHSPNWLSRFSDMARQAATYRQGCVFLAGDAAHVHAPSGGQGLNIGVQDAVNLGWKLAQVIRGASPDSLLDTYHAERHPIAARVLRLTKAQTALGRGDESTEALREVMTDLLGMDEPRQRYGGIMSGLDVRYDFGEGHPLVGRRMPDLDLATAQGPVRVFDLLHGARPVLLNMGQPGSLDPVRRMDRVKVVDARFDGVWDLPVLGRVAAPSAVLIRPDGYVAWVGEGTIAGLEKALFKWFGQAAA